MSERQETLATVPGAARAAPGRLYLLAIVKGVATTHPLPSSGSCFIGRSRECAVRIDDPSLSRRHACLVLSPSPTISDLGTMNGSRVRGQRLAPEQPVPIGLGEVVELGDAAVLVQRAPGGPGGQRGEDHAMPAASEDPMAQLHLLVDRIAPGTLSVLITGETGAGKEVLAERIHRASPRAAGPFVRLNCAAFTEALLESELFGHEKGAFTGAGVAKPGLLETAQGGTVLLDEIGEVPLPVQVKLLRVLEQRQVLRVGALHPRAIDVRFLGATNRNLEDEVVRGAFREDLYFRLAGITLRVPPLRERPREIEALARTFALAASGALSRRAPVLSEEALRALLAHSWPGNVRELRNTLERAVLLAGDAPIAQAHLHFQPSLRRADSATPAPPKTGEAGERERILDALFRAGGSQTRAAELLGISRRTLTNRLNEYQLPRPRK